MTAADSSNDADANLTSRSAAPNGTHSAADIIDTNNDGKIDTDEAIKNEPISADDYAALGLTVDTTPDVNTAQKSVDQAQAALNSATTDEQRAQAQAALDKANADLTKAKELDADARSKAPYDTNQYTYLEVPGEIYVAANGACGNKYTVRDGFDALNGRGSDASDHSSAYGTVYDTYDYYGINRGRKNYGTSSNFSSNTGNALAQGDADFNGMYATSVAFSHNTGQNAKKNWIAELHAYAGTSVQTVQIDNQKVYASGGIVIFFYSLDAHGNRTGHHMDFPTVTRGQLGDITTKDGKTTSRYLYLDAGYNQEYDAYFDIEAADVDGDGADEIFAYTGAYEDKDGIRYAIVDMFKFKTGADGSVADNADTVHYTTKIACGPASEYLDSSTQGWDGNYSAWEALKRAPVVTLCGGDVDRDKLDEIAICTSAPTGHSHAADAAHASIFKWNAQASRLETFEGMDQINLFQDGADKDGKKYCSMVSANVAFGTFSIPGKNKTVDAFVFAGYQTNDGDETALLHEPVHKSGDKHPYSRFAYRFLYYDVTLKKWITTDYTEHLLDRVAWQISNSYHLEGRRYVPVFAPLALACANIDGVLASFDAGQQGTIENDEILVGGDIYEATFSEYTKEDKTKTSKIEISQKLIGSISLCDAQDNHSGNNKNKEQIWIGDVVAGLMSSLPDDYTYGESFLAVVGIHRDEDLRKNDDYYWYDLSLYSRKRVPIGESKDGKNSKDNQGKYTLDKTDHISGEEGVICEGNRRTENYNSWISLALPDIDNDAIKMRYVDAARFVTEPTLAGVLQDAPYYRDLEESEHYLVLGGTEFGTSRKTTEGSGYTISGEAGGYVEGSVGCIVKLQGEAELVAKAGYEHESANSIEFGITFESHAGEGDKVVLYAIPMTYYYYQAYDPVENKWKDVILPQTGTPSYSIISAEKYDSIVEAIRARWEKDHPGAQMHYSLPKVSELIRSTSGDPLTYTEANLGFAVDPDTPDPDTVKRSEKTIRVTNSKGATTDQDITIENESTSSYEVGGALNIRIGAEVGFLKILEAGAGAVFGFEGGYTTMTTTSNGTTFGGSVDNLPDDATGYGFTWQLVSKYYPGKFEIESDGTKSLTRYVNDNNDPQGVWLVGFVATDVQKPDLPMVDNLAVQQVNDTSVVLTWDPADGIDKLSPQKYPNVQYIVYRVSENGDVTNYTDPVAVPYYTTDANGKKTLTNSLTYKGLTANAPYRFVIRLANTDANGNITKDHDKELAGIYSPVTEMRTMGAGESFYVSGITPSKQTVTLDKDGKATEDVTYTVTANYKGDVRPSFEWKYLFVDRSDEDPKKWNSSWKSIGYSTADNKYAEIEWPSGRKGTIAYQEGTTDTGEKTVTVTLRIKASQLTAEDDGTWFHCVVSYGNGTINSQDAQLRVHGVDTNRAMSAFKTRARLFLPLRGENMRMTNYFAPAAESVEPVPPVEPVPSVEPVPNAGEPTAKPASHSGKASADEALPQTGDATPSGLAGVLAGMGAALSAIGLYRRKSE